VRLVFLIAILALVAGTRDINAQYQVEVIASGLSKPWSLAFLPDGTMLVTELGGQLRRVDRNGQISEPLSNIPAVYFNGQGGLFDVLLHPDFERNNLIYLSYADGGKNNNATAIVRARLTGDSLEKVQQIYRVSPAKDTGAHYGAKMVFLPDGTMLLTTGDGFNYREAAQDISSGLGKTIRINDDGTPADGNPFPDSPYVWTYGHRNPQGLAVGAAGEVWLHEHGPQGGDEVNLLKPGVNYGWPAITYGVDYSGATISPYTEWPGMAQPVVYWVPSIAPSGLAIYDGDLFPAWRGDLFAGALAGQELRRIDLENGKVVAQESLLKDRNARIRDVRNGPDGALYLLTDADPGEILRLVPDAND